MKSQQSTHVFVFYLKLQEWETSRLSGPKTKPSHRRHTVRPNFVHFNVIDKDGEVDDDDDDDDDVNILTI